MTRLVAIYMDYVIFFHSVTISGVCSSTFLKSLVDSVKFQQTNLLEFFICEVNFSSLLKLTLQNSVFLEKYLFFPILCKYSQFNPGNTGHKYTK